MRHFQTTPIFLNYFRRVPLPLHLVKKMMQMARMKVMLPRAQDSRSNCHCCSSTNNSKRGVQVDRLELSAVRK